MKTPVAKFSVDSGWHKSKKTTPLPVLAAGENAACVAVIGILQNARGTPEGLQVLKADGEIKLSKFGFAFKQPQKICQGCKEGV